MLKDITIGQYYPTGSVVHKLDPRVKLVGTVVFIVSLFLIRNIPGLILVSLTMCLVIGISKVPPKMMMRGIRAIWVLILITAFCNLFFSQGGDIYWKAGPLTLSSLSVHNGVYFTIRLIYLVVGTSVMTLTTSPNRLTDGMEEGLKPLTRQGVPVHDIAMMMSIALRFIPILGEEADKIKKAQMARGANFDEGSLIERAKALIPILVPLFISAFRRAGDLGLAMESRCYRGGEGRTKMNPLKYERRDRIAYVVILLFLAAVILMRIFCGVWL